MANDVEKVANYLKLLAESGYYGEVTIKYKEGSIYHIITSASHKPHNLPARSSDADS